MLPPVLRQQIIREIREKSHPLDPIPTNIAAKLHPLSEIRCVAFDVYGTLLISTAGEIGIAHDASSGAGPFAIVAGTLGLPRDRAVSVAEAFHERVSLHHKRAHREGRPHPEVDIRTIWDEVIAQLKPPEIPPSGLIALTYELAANPVWPMPGAGALLRSLTERGIRIALVSNAQFYTPLILEELLGESLDGFNITPRVWSYEIGEAKPSPGPFRLLTNELSAEAIAPGETLYLGNDMLNDVVTAQDQGLRAVLFAGDARSLRCRTGMAEVEGRTPDAVVTALEQLPAIIESR